MRPAELRRLLRACALSDSAFDLRSLDGALAFVGPCIHCGTKLVLAEDGSPRGAATLEHIMPLTHGGTNALENLAVACRRCNNLKGTRIDARRAEDPELERVVGALAEKRAQRWRDPGEAEAAFRKPTRLPR